MPKTKNINNIQKVAFLYCEFNEKPEAIASGFFGGTLAIIFYLSIFAWSSAYVLFEGLRKILCILITAVLGDHVDMKIGLLK
jgi:hypothetical protein